MSENSTARWRRRDPDDLDVVQTYDYYPVITMIRF